MRENGFGCALISMLIASQIFRRITELCSENAKVGVSPFKRLLLNKSKFAHNYEKAILLIPSNFLRWPTTVTAITNTSRQNQKCHGKTKLLTAKPKRSRQNQKAHGKTKKLTAMPKRHKERMQGLAGRTSVPV